MKKFLLPLLLLACFTACKRSTELTADEKVSVEKGAREFCDQYFKLWQDLKFEDVIASYEPDASGFSNGMFMTTDDFKKWMHDNPNIIKKIIYTYDTIAVYPIDINNASVTLRYFFSQQDTSKTINATGNVNFLLNKKGDQWKIASYAEYADYSPLLLSGELTKNRMKFQADLNDKFGNSVFQINAINLANISVQKKVGKSPHDLGMMIGKIFVPGWPKDEGFEGFKKDLIYNMQVLTTKLEIVESSDLSAKIRVYKDYKSWLPDNVTDKDVLEFYRGLTQPIADYMGSKADIADNGDFWIMTISKK